MILIRIEAKTRREFICRVRYWGFAPREKFLRRSASAPATAAFPVTKCRCGWPPISAYFANTD